MHALKNWDPENATCWESGGKTAATRNLWISIPNLLMAFGVWIYWSIIINVMQGLHDGDAALYAFTGADGQPLSGPAYQALLYTLPAVADSREPPCAFQTPL